MKRILGLVLVLLAIAGGVTTARKLLNNSPAPSSGSLAYDQGRKAGRYTAPVVIVVVAILGLRLLFQAGGQRPPPPPSRPNPTGGLPPVGHPSLRGGQDTIASNPARLRLDIGQWLAANPWVVWVAASLALAGAVVLFIKPVPGIGLLLAAGGLVFREIREAKHKFFAGDVCPGIVLSAQGNLVAVFTNLSPSGGQRPAIKILKQPLQRLTLEPAYDGMRVAAAALYCGDVRKPAWQDFSPEVISCVVHNPEEIARVLDSIPAEDWQALEDCLARIPVANPGLYRMWDPTDGPAPESPQFAAPRPWFTTRPALVLFAVCGVILVFTLVVGVVGPALLRPSHRPPPGLPTQWPPPPASTPAPHPPGPAGPAPAQWNQAGPYSAGSDVEAQWAGQWIPGRIESINPGGFSVMVKLSDARFPNPIVLSTNQLRLR